MVSLDAQLLGIEAAVAAIKRGEVVAVPTETVYGLGADPTSKTATGKLFKLKERPDSLALPVLVPNTASALRLVEPGKDAEALEVLAERFWPGPLTLVVRRSSVEAKGQVMFLGGDDGAIGLRCPGLDLMRELLEECGPLAVTSANRHGEPPCTRPEQLAALFGDRLGGILDGGECSAVASSVVSLLGERPVLLRPGPISLQEVIAALADG